MSAVIFLSGWSGYPELFPALAPELAAAGRFLVPFGPQDEEETVARLAALARDLGPAGEPDAPSGPRPLLLAWSTGAHLTLKHRAALFPLFSRLILAAPFLSFTAHVPAAKVKLMIRGLKRDPEAVVREFHALCRARGPEMGLENQKAERENKKISSVGPEPPTPQIGSEPAKPLLDKGGESEGERSGRTIPLAMGGHSEAPLPGPETQGPGSLPRPGDVPGAFVPDHVPTLIQGLEFLLESRVPDPGLPFAGVKGPDIVIVRGDGDAVVPVQASREAAALLAAEGFLPRVLVGLHGHLPPETMLSALLHESPHPPLL